jgi:hypothetical protein
MAGLFYHAWNKPIFMTSGWGFGTVAILLDAINQV